MPGNYYFLTLTMPGRGFLLRGDAGVEAAMASWKRLRKWLGVNIPGFAYYRVAEWQRRGVLHFHVIIRSYRRLILGTQAHGSVPPIHVRRAVSRAGFGRMVVMERLYTGARGVASYCAKYLAKGGELLAKTYTTALAKKLRLTGYSRDWIRPEDKPGPKPFLWELRWFSRCKDWAQEYRFGVHAMAELICCGTLDVGDYTKERQHQTAWLWVNAEAGVVSSVPKGVQEYVRKTLEVPRGRKVAGGGRRCSGKRSLPSGDSSVLQREPDGCDVLDIRYDDGEQKSAASGGFQHEGDFVAIRYGTYAQSFRAAKR